MTSNEGGFTVISNDLIRHRELSTTEKVILFSLLSYLNVEQQRAWPSITTIAECAGVSEFWAREQLKALETKGYIKTEKRPGHVTRYEILTPQQSCARNNLAPATELQKPRNNLAGNPATNLRLDRNKVAPINTNNKEQDTNTKDKHELTTRARDAEIEAEFEEFWKAYPKPQNPDKTPGRKRYVALRKKGVPADDLLRAAQGYANATRGTAPKYIKHCATFLGPSEAWRDYLNKQEAQPQQEQDGEAEYMRDAANAGLISLEEYRFWRSKNGI